MDPQSWNEGRRDYLGWIESWRQKAVVDNDALWLLKRYQHRPVLELYKVSEDPYELTNLAANPEYADVVRNLKEKLLVWMESQGDKGREIEGVLSVKKSRNMSE